MLRWGIILLCTRLMVVSSDYDETGYDRTIGYYLLRTYPCEEPFSLDYTVAAHYEETGSDTFFNFTVDLDYPLTEKTEMEIIVDNWDNGDWDEVFMKLGRGPVCDVLKEYHCLPCRLWTDIRREIKPPIKDECYIEEGHYELKKFRASMYDFNPGAQFVLLGTYRTTLRLYEDGYLLMCQRFEVEVHKI